MGITAGQLGVFLVTLGQRNLFSTWCGLGRALQYGGYYEPEN